MPKDVPKKSRAEAVGIRAAVIQRRGILFAAAITSVTGFVSYRYGLGQAGSRTCFQPRRSVEGTWSGRALSVDIAPVPQERSAAPHDFNVIADFRHCGDDVSGSIVATSRQNEKERYAEVLREGRVEDGQTLSLSFAASKEKRDFGVGVLEIANDGGRLGGFVLANDLYQPGLVFLRVDLERQ